MKINPFDVFAEMVRTNNKKIELAPLNNVLRMNRTKQGDQITIGTADGTMVKIYSGKVRGGLVLCDSEEFERVKAELESRP